MKFYHASMNDSLHNTTLSPRIPLNKFDSEDNTTLRVCVSASILGCLSATPRYSIGDIVYIYECESDNYIQPSIEQVIDAPITGEIWITEDVQMKYFCKIKIEDRSRFKLNENLHLPVYYFSIIEEEERKDD